MRGDKEVTNLTLPQGDTKGQTTYFLITICEWGLGYGI